MPLSNFLTMLFRPLISLSHLNFSINNGRVHCVRSNFIALNLALSFLSRLYCGWNVVILIEEVTCNAWVGSSLIMQSLSKLQFVAGSGKQMLWSEGKKTKWRLTELKMISSRLCQHLVWTLKVSIEGAFKCFNLIQYELDFTFMSSTNRTH